METEALLRCSHESGADPDHEQDESNTSIRLLFASYIPTGNFLSKFSFLFFPVLHFPLISLSLIYFLLLLPWLIIRLSGLFQSEIFWNYGFYSKPGGLPGRVTTPGARRGTAHIQKRDEHTSMLRVGFKLTIPVFERARKFPALDCATTVTYGPWFDHPNTHPPFSMFEKSSSARRAVTVTDDCMKGV
jgi:hypothetical protein